MKPHESTPPPGKTEKIQYYYTLYRASEFSKDREIFEEIIKITGHSISVATLKRYKKEQKWKRPNKGAKLSKPAKAKAQGGKKKPHQKPAFSLPGKSQQKKAPPNNIRRGDPAPPRHRGRPRKGVPREAFTPPEPAGEAAPPLLIMPEGNRYSDAEKLRLVEAISETYAQLQMSVEGACRYHNLPPKTFYDWINNNGILHDIYQRGIRQLDLSFITESDYHLKRKMLHTLQHDREVEVRRYYTYESEPDQETGEMVNRRKCKSEVEIERTSRVDTTLLATINFISQLKVLLLQQRPPPTPATMSTGDIKERIRELEKKVADEGNQPPGGDGSPRPDDPSTDYPG